MTLSPIRVNVFVDWDDDDVFGEPLTVSGNEITDTSRAAALAGDGRGADSSYGIWEAVTNLITNGGAETDTTGWVEQGSTTTRSLAQQKFGDASLQVVTDDAGANEGPYHAFAGAASTKYTVSAWVGGTSGTVRIALYDNVSGKQASAAVTLSATPQRITLTATTGAGAVTFRVYVETDDQQDITFFFDGAQCEAQPIATPYVQTDGGTAARSAARVRMPIAGVLDETQSWAAFRVRPGYDYDDEPHADPILFNWEDDSDNRITGSFDTGADAFQIERFNGGASDIATTATTFSKDDIVTVIFAWTATTVVVSLNGAAFASTGGSDIPALAATLADIGSADGAGQHVDGDVLWAAFGSGTLTDTDAATIHAFANEDPQLDTIPGTPTAVWYAADATLITVASFEDVTGEVLDVSWDRGRSSVNDQMAMGTATVTLLNVDGKYSPFDTGSDIYPNMVPGRKVKIQIANQSTTYPIFFGRISDISQGLDPHDAPTVELSLEDEFGRLGLSRYRSAGVLVTLEGGRVDSLIGLIINAEFAGEMVHSLERGSGGIWRWAMDDTHLQAFRTAAHQELGGSVFMSAGDNGAGLPVLVFYNREHRSAQPIHATFTGPQALDMQLRQSDWIDEVIHRRAGLTASDDVTPIYNLFPTGRELATGSADPINTINGRYIYSATNVVEPVADIDYTVNAAADGSGQDLTKFVSVDSFTSFGGGFQITFDNASGLTGYLTLFQIRGQVVRQSGEEREITVTDASAPVKNQTLRDTFDFNDDADAIKGYAQFRLFAGTTFYPRRLDVLLRPRDDSEATDILGIDLAKRLTITNTTGLYPSEINADFIVEHISGSYTPEAGLIYRCTLWHEVAAIANFFRISGAAGDGNDYSQIVGDAATVGDRIAF